MACCGRGRNPKVKALKEEPKVLKHSLKILQEYKDADPTSFNQKLLQDYHMDIHRLYASTIKRRPINKTFINTIVQLHDKFVNEIIRRKLKHKTPLNKI